MSRDHGTLLVTGDSGFVGGYVHRAMSCVGLDDDDGVVDIMDAERVRSAVERIRPDNVIHLAALSFVPDSFQNPQSTTGVNVLGTVNLLDALDRAGFVGRFLYVSSGEVYGLVSETQLPVTEELPLMPRNPYAASKVAAEAVCSQWGRTSGFDVLIARPFNHIGPGQDHRFAIADFARQIAGIAAGLTDPVISVGDIDVSRDFCDVRDIVQAYSMLLTDGESGVAYNVCSGREYVLRSLIEKMADILGADLRVEQDAARFRPSDQRRVCGSYARLAAATGWRPAIDIDITLSEIVNHELERLSR